MNDALRLFFSVVKVMLLVAILVILVDLKSICNSTDIVKTTTIEPKARIMRVTGYLPTGNKTALMENVKVGYTAAVSPACIDMLGSKVFIKGYGVRYINDLTADWLDEKYALCTIDLAVPSETEALKIGNSSSVVIRIK